MPSTPIPLDTLHARRLLARNASFTVACALPMIVAGGAVARAAFGSADGSTLVTAIGVALFGYAAALFFARTQPAARLRRWLLAFSAADAAWVLGTALLLLAMPAAFTPMGQAAAVLIAVIVAWFGVCQLRAGLGR